MRHLCPHTVRYIDEDTKHDKLYEITLNTVQDRFFFVPFRLLNLLIIGVLAYAQQATRLKICYVVFLSNHAHLLIRTRCAEQVARFFCLANSQIAKEVQRLVDWTGGIFSQRFTITAVTDEPEAQVERLRYLMSQGVKEGLCPHPSKWPGVQSATALLSGTMVLVGTWIDRSKFYDMHYIYQRAAALKAANRRRNSGLPKHQRRRFRGVGRRRPREKDFSQTLELELSTLPCWDHLSPEETVSRCCALVEEIMDEHATTIDKLPRNWRNQIADRAKLASRPNKRRLASVKPKLHAASKEEWVLWIKRWESWIDLYERASARLRRGIKEALDDFPLGAFIPSGVYSSPSRPPPLR